MSRDEKGYSLPEVMTAMFILGVTLSFSIPIFTLMKAQAQTQLMQTEAMALLQAKMERISQSRVPGAGKEMAESRMISKLTYQLRWNCSQIQPSLYQLDVVIEWKDKKGVQQQLRLKTHRYQTDG